MILLSLVLFTYQFLQDWKMEQVYKAGCNSHGTHEASRKKKLNKKKIGNSY